MKYFVSIIIPALNEERHIEGCLKAIFSLNSHNVQYEIIVVDNGSSDRTLDIARSFGVRVIIAEKVHIATLRNLGAKIAYGNIFAFVDADCIVSRDWIVNAVKCFETTNAALVGSFHKNPEGGGWLAKTSEIISRTKTGGNVNYIPSGNMFVKRECFVNVGGFDESLETNEDVEFCQRLKWKGHKIFAESSIEATHLGIPRSLKEFFMREIWHGKSSFRVFLNDLKQVMNLKVVIYSVAFALLLVNFIIGSILYVFTNNSILVLLDVFFFFLLILVISYRIGKRQPAFFSVLLYNILYGIARGLSLIMFLCNKLIGAVLKKREGHGAR